MADGRPLLTAAASRTRAQPHSMLPGGAALLRRTAALLLLSLPLASASAGGSMMATPPPRPPKAGAWHTGLYRNLFAESGVASDAASAAKVEAAFQQLFYGNCSGQRDQPGDQRLFFWADASTQSEAYIHSVDSDDVRSEGMSYGMMVTVQLDKQKEFDALFCAPLLPRLLHGPPAPDLPARAGR